MKFQRQWIGWLLVGSVLGPTVASVGAQQGVPEDRPLPLETGPLTREQLDRHKAEQLLRHARTLYGLGIRQLRYEQIVEAIQTLEEAARLDPESTAAKTILVPLYLQVGRSEELLRVSQEVLERDPENYEVWGLRGVHLKELARYEEALAAFQAGTRSRRIRAAPHAAIQLQQEVIALAEKLRRLPAAEAAHRACVQLLQEHRDRLLREHGYTAKQIAQMLASHYESLGKLALTQQQFDAAVQAFHAAQKVFADPQQADEPHAAGHLHWNLCEVYYAQQKWVEALRALDAYLALHPSQVEPYERKIQLLRKLGRANDIIPQLRRHLEHEPNHVGLHLLYARELGREPAQWQAAQAIYLKLLRSHTDAAIYRGLFQLLRRHAATPTILTMLDDALKLAVAKDDPKVLPDDRSMAITRAKEMLAVLRSEPEISEALIRQALDDLGQQRREYCYETWRMLAVLAGRTQQLPAAEKLFRQALLHAPPWGEAEVYEGLLRVLMMQRQWEEVVRVCRLGLQRAQAINQVLLHYYLALAWANLGRADEAIRSADDAIRLANDGNRLLIRLRKVHVYRLLDQHEAAIREAQELLKEYTQPLQIRDIRYALAGIYSEMKDHARSEQQLRLILEMDPNDATANNDLGYQLADRNVALDEAETMIRKAIDLDRAQRKDFADDEPDNAAYLDSLGWVLFRKGQLREALHWLEKSAQLPLGAEDPTVWDHLGEVYAALGEREQAQRAYQRALKLYESDRRSKKEGRPDEVRRKLERLSRR